MAQVNFMPTTDAEKDLWAKNLASKLGQFATKYSITAAELADIQQGSVWFSYWVNYRQQLEEYFRKVSTFKNEVRDGIDAGSLPSVMPVFPTFGTPPPAVAPGVFDRMRSIALRIKKHYAYTEADGDDLGITNKQKTAVNLLTVKPVISVRLNNGRPEVEWTKKNMTGIVLHVNRGNGFEPLATDHVPNYIDQYPLEKGQTAVWKYKGIYLYKDDTVGFYSDDVSITVTGRD